MSLIPIKNDSQSPMYVGGFMILPGETRHIEDHHVPAHLRAAPEASTPAPAPDAIADLLGKPIPAIVEAITARDDRGAPTFSDEDLARLKTTEESGKARKGLMAAITEEELLRASEHQGADPDMDAFAESLKAMGEDELLGQLDLVKENPAAIAAVEAEINRRHGGAQ